MKDCACDKVANRRNPNWRDCSAKISERRKPGPLLHTGLSVPNDSYIFESFHMIMLVELDGNLFDALVESRPLYLSKLPYETRPNT